MLTDAESLCGQMLIQLINIFTFKRTGTEEQASMRKISDADTMSKLAQWRRDGKNSRPKFQVFVDHDRDHDRDSVP